MSFFLSFGSCLVGTYVEKSYQFIGKNAKENDFDDGYHIEDTNDHNFKWAIDFDWGEMHVYSIFIPYRTLAGPYRMRFYLSSDNIINRVNINNISLKYNDMELKIIDNIEAINIWDNSFIEDRISIDRLQKFYDTMIIDIPKNTSIRKFDLELSNINIPYKKVEQIKLIINIEIYFENNNFEKIEREYSLIRINKKYKGSFQ
jgi:hypothetical protein